MALAEKRYRVLEVASESQPLVPSLKMRCHSFQRPCSYCIEDAPDGHECLVAIDPFGSDLDRRRISGMSATFPTASRLTSCRTRTERQ